MHNNYYFIRQVSRFLDRQLRGWELTSCFSQNKNELILVFAKSAHEFTIRASLNPEFSCLSFPEAFQRSRKNSVDLFTEVMGSTVSRIYQYENERSFAIHFESGNYLLFKLHGARSNILHCRENKVIALFRNKIVKDRTIDPQGLDRPIEQTYSAFANAGFDFKALFPSFNAAITEYLEEIRYFEADNLQKWKILEHLKDQLENPAAYYIITDDEKPNFSLIKRGISVMEYTHPLEAVTRFFLLYTREYYLSKEKKELLDKMENLLGKTGNYLIKSREKLEDVETKSRHEDIANIIMANINNIPPKSEEADLYDFYTDQTINVRLKKDLTPQKNAEIYYRKAKNQKFEIKNIKENIYLKQKELQRIEKHIATIKPINDIKTLRNYIKDNNLQRSKAVNEEGYPFRQFVFQDYEIWVGKSAKSNDDLTMKYTKKDDIWLHAKDVTGSHVVIKYKPRQPVPRPVIEKAAQLAAYYSKRKTDTLCPVLYTPKKYVRKPKGALPGQVIVDREEVILVKPEKEVPIK